MKFKLAHLIIASMPFTVMAGDGSWGYTGKQVNRLLFIGGTCQVSMLYAVAA